ncbi:FGGY-family carbohydrate kinase [Phytohabitans sp. ZYX-F-186]|uniref:FGGY-family carbohydrate kinase n=1 Tax=Phytohabitans maris TaxID=3071409 RepID=A0ABU0ZG56_9ACTN|nr:FGGY-family carbohydrate kinase [Phytohabitans sp. ZYX-F-186]MDQ7906045.1 FGGY-family carbohydrate kinase [Phytohabitans sp. ZYX-F-186]
MSALFLGIDVGTSSTKGVLVRPDGEIVASASRAHEFDLPRPGWAEHDADQIWWGDFVAIARSLTAPLAEPVTAVGVSGIGPVLQPTDERDRPLRPAILYGIDTRAGQEIDELNAELGADAIAERAGAPLTSQAIGPKLRWLRRHEPEVWRRTRRIHMANSYLVRRLTGEYVLDHHSASQAIPLYDSRKLDWADGWAAAIAEHIELPRLAWPAETAGLVTATAAAETGIPAGTPVTTGTIDAWTEALSVGVRRPGDVMLMYGTTMFIIAALDARRVSPPLWGTVGTFPGTFSLAAGMATSGATADWVRRLAGQPDFAGLAAEAGQSPPGANGLLMLPYLAGERSPLFDPDARGILAGLTLRHGRGDVYRAALEATAYGVRHNLESFAEAGAEPRRLVAVGGGTTGGLWTRIVSDVLQRPQSLCATPIGACLGAAYLAALTAGADVDIDAWNPVVTLVEPDPAHAAVYDEGYALYRRLYHDTVDIAHALAARQV